MFITFTLCQFVAVYVRRCCDLSGVGTFKINITCLLRLLTRHVFGPPCICFSLFRDRDMHLCMFVQLVGKHIPCMLASNTWLYRLSNSASATVTFFMHFLPLQLVLFCTTIFASALSYLFHINVLEHVVKTTAVQRFDGCVQFEHFKRGCNRPQLHAIQILLIKFLTYEVQVAVQSS